MKLENNRQYIRTEMIKVVKNQKTRWTIFFMSLGWILLITYLVNDIFLNGFITGFIFSGFIYTLVSFKTDRTMKWFKREFIDFKENIE